MPEQQPHAKDRGRTTLSLVWLVPLAALVVSLWVAWQSYSSRGPLIEIVLDSAGGVEEGKTLIKHRDVKVGVVEQIGFTDDGAKVRVLARMDKPIARFLDEGTNFWIVSPEVSVQGIRGLDTVLSGSYIEASWDLEEGDARRSFTALDAPPLTPPDAPGRRLRLIAQDGGTMSVGAPVFYKRIEVGRIEAKELTPDGEAVVFDIFVEAPHHRRLSSGSRFWGTSGFDVELGADGAKVKVESLVSILRGGIAFDTIAIGGQPVEDYELFRLFDAEQSARASIFEDSYGEQIRLSVVFDGSVRGLSPGAPVELRGYKVGEVVEVTADFGRGDTPEVSLVTEILLQPSRLGQRPGEETESLDFLRTLVRNGLRAKLANASLITGALYVQLVEDPDAAPAEIDESAIPYPRLPSVSSDFDDLAATAEGLLNRVNALPIEELLTSATTLMVSLNALAIDESTRAVPGEVNALLADARGLLGDPALKQAFADVASAASAAEGFASALGNEQLIADLTAAVSATRTTTQNLAAASAAAPALLTSLASVSGNVNDLPLDQLIASATGATDQARAFFAAESTQGLPADLSRTLAEIEMLLADLRQADTATTLVMALENAGAAAAELPETILSVRALADQSSLAAQEVPETLRSVRALTDQAGEGLPEALDSIRQLADETKVAAAELPSTLQSLRALSDRTNEAMVEVPETLRGVRSLAARSEEAMAAVPETLTSLRGLTDGAGPAAANLPETLESVRALADTANVAFAELPETLKSVRALSDEATLVAREAPAAVASVRVLAERAAVVADKAAELPLEDLILEARGLLVRFDALASSDATREVPENLNEALSSVRELVEELRSAETAQRLANLLDEARVSAQSITATSDAVPEMLKAVESVTNRIEALPLEALVGSAQTLLVDIDRIVTAPGAEQMPGALVASLDEVRRSVARLTELQVPENFNSALISFDVASRSFDVLSADLQAVLPVIQQVSNRADNVLSSLDVGSELNYEAVSMIREIRDAARAITTLAGTVERRPNSLILGK